MKTPGWRIVFGLGLCLGWLAAAGCEKETDEGGGGTTASSTTSTQSCTPDSSCPGYAQQGAGKFCDGGALWEASFACDTGCCSCEALSLGICGTSGCIDAQDGNARCAGSGGAGGADGGMGGSVGGTGGAGGQ